MARDGDQPGRTRHPTSSFSASRTIKQDRPPEMEEGSGLIPLRRMTNDPLEQLRMEIAQLKRWREQHIREHHELDKQKLEQDHVNDTIDERLKAGAESFAGVRASLDTTKKSIEDLATAISPKPMSAGKVAMIIIGLITSVGFPVGALIWSAAKYPDREEFNQQQTVIENVSAQQGAIKAQVNTTEAAVRRIEAAQEKIDEKIDKLSTRRR